MKRLPASKQQCGSARASVLMCSLLLCPLLLIAAQPAWWQQRGVINPALAPNDFAPVNQGQLKNMLKAAVAEMDEKLPGGAGQPLHQLLASWAQSTAQAKDYAPVNLGQLKNAAKPVYDRLILLNLAQDYPWNASAAPTADYALANIGQVKNVFALQIHYTAPQGWLDWLASNNLPGNTRYNDPSGGSNGQTYWQKYLADRSVGQVDTDVDGVPDALEIAAGTDPSFKDNPLVRLTAHAYAAP